MLKSGREILVILCIAAGCITMFMLVNLETLHSDQLYQALCVRRYREAPLGLLVYWIGHLWCDLFGFSLLNLRILTSIELTLSVGIASCFLYSMTRNSVLSAAMFLTGCLLLRAGTFDIYNWDTGIYIFTTVSLCLMVSYVKKQSPSTLLWLGFFIGLTTLGRTPSAILLPLSLIWVWYASYEKKGVKQHTVNFCVICIGWLAAMLIFTSIILGSPEEYIKSFLDGNLISGHSPTSDYKRLSDNLIRVFCLVPTIWFMGLGTILTSVLLVRIKKPYLVFIILALWVLFNFSRQSLFASHTVKTDLDHGIDTPFGISLLIIPPLLALFFKNYKISRETKTLLWACVIILIGISFGSDVFMRRMTVGFSIPIIMGILWNIKFSPLTRFIKTYIPVAIITLVTAFYTHTFTIYTIRNIDKDFFKKTDIKPFDGLTIASPRINEIESAYKAVTLVRKQGFPYIYLGNHYLTELAAGPDAVTRFHDYHLELYQYHNWINNKEIFINNIDVAIYPLEGPYYELPAVVDDLKKEGFTDSIRMNKTVILYRHNPKNKRKI